MRSKKKKMTNKEKCKNCGKLILEQTFIRTNGYCEPCKWKLSSKEKSIFLTKDQEDNQKKFQDIYSNILFMNKDKILQLRCPTCSTGFQIAYIQSESFPLRNGLIIMCNNYLHCGNVVNMDGLSSKPEWLKELPFAFKVNSDGTYEEIVYNENPKPIFHIGDKVVIISETEKFNNLIGIVRKIEWNFTKKCWDYLLNVNGEPFPKRFKKEEIIISLI